MAVRLLIELREHFMAQRATARIQKVKAVIPYAAIIALEILVYFQNKYESFDST